MRDLEHGPIAAIWEHALSGSLQPIHFETKREAFGLRARLYRYRDAARRQGHPIAVALDELAISVLPDEDGTWLLRIIPAAPIRLKTLLEQREEAILQQTLGCGQPENPVIELVPEAQKEQQ